MGHKRLCDSYIYYCINKIRVRLNNKFAALVERVLFVPISNIVYKVYYIVYAHHCPFMVLCFFRVHNPIHQAWHSSMRLSGPVVVTSIPVTHNTLPHWGNVCDVIPELYICASYRYGNKLTSRRDADPVPIQRRHSVRNVGPAVIHVWIQNDIGSEYKDAAKSFCPLQNVAGYGDVGQPEWSVTIAYAMSWYYHLVESHAAPACRKSLDSVKMDITWVEKAG